MKREAKERRTGKIKRLNVREEVFILSPTWTGQASVSVDAVFYIGPLNNTALHQHHAHQIYFALDGPIELRTDPDEPWQSYSAVIIRSDQPHAMLAHGTSAAMAMMEPLNASHLEIESLLEGKAINALSDERVATFLARLNELHAAPYSEEELLRIKHAFLSTLCLTTGEPGFFDERIAKALKLIQDNPGYPWKVEALASKVDMSIRHFRHLFVKQAGLPPLRYIKWIRVIWAAKQLLSGTSVGQAAIISGFADAGHLTRSFRDLTGSLPTSVSKTLEAHFPGDTFPFKKG
jgi:AraC-like DNA-binding protein